MSRLPVDDAFDPLLTAALQARPLPAVSPRLASDILARARNAEAQATAALRRVRWAQQAATLVAAALLLVIALVGGAQILAAGTSALADSTAIESSIASLDEATTTSLSSATSQMAASFGLGLALAVTLLIGMHSGLSGNSARLRW